MTDRLDKLEVLVDTLRGPEGCPWDREQTLADVRAYLVEEAHEVAAAIDLGDADEIGRELGDLLFQLVFTARLLDEAGPPSTLRAAIDSVHEKMVDRHPHVFGSEVAPDSDAVRRAWEERKLARGSGSALAGVPSTLPALVGAYRMSQKAAGVGFDWPDADSVMTKIEEELGELAEALRQPASREDVDEEIGDLMFTVANLARKLRLDPEASLQRANRKFSRRFRQMESRLGAERKLSDLTATELEALWTETKDAAGKSP